jgi:hypothetical protein
VPRNSMSCQRDNNGLAELAKRSPQHLRDLLQRRIRDGVLLHLIGQQHRPHEANLSLEEPYALIAHVRVCGSPGRATAQGHPATLELTVGPNLSHEDCRGADASCCAGVPLAPGAYAPNFSASAYFSSTPIRRLNSAKPIRRDSSPSVVPSRRTFS